MKSFINDMKEKQAFSILSRIFLICLDIVFINLSSFLALWLRFNMHISEINERYLASVIE